MRPRLIIFDESTSMLDPSGRRDVLNCMQQLHREGIGILLITHHMEEAGLADRVILMANGEIVASGTPREILTRTSLLRELHLEAPLAAEIAVRLHADGLIDRTDILKIEELVEAVCRLR